MIFRSGSPTGSIFRYYHNVLTYNYKEFSFIVFHLLLYQILKFVLVFPVNRSYVCVYIHQNY